MNHIKKMCLPLAQWTTTAATLTHF